MKKLIVSLFLLALTCLILTPAAEACLMFSGARVGTATVKWKKGKKPNVFLISYKIKWGRGVKAKFQGIRLHRFIFVKENASVKFLAVQKGIPPHGVAASRRTNRWIKFEVWIGKKYQPHFKKYFGGKKPVFQKDGKKGASFGEPFAPGDGRPKGGCGPDDPQWVKKPKPRPKSSDF